MINRVFFSFFTAAGAVFLISCQPASVTNNNQQAVNSMPANTSPNGNVKANGSQAAAKPDLPVTMPLVDAMFEDEKFREEAKRAAGLSDEEIDKIRTAARDAVLELNGGVEGDTNRSTRASVESTRKELERLVGADKAARFMSYVSTRWAGSEGAIAPARPNEVPADTRIVVNAPAYRMDIFKDGQLAKTYRIGIGYPEFPLPVGLRKANEIIFNPEWTPPDEPWVRGKVRPGQTVAAGSKLNPLGLAKIPIGLPSLIHGGKDQARLGTFASHGCVGLTDALMQDLSLELASITGVQLSSEDIAGFKKNRTETKNVQFPQPIPVELRYETIVAGDGKVTIYRDVYERGTNTQENLQRVLEANGVSFDSLTENERTQLLQALEQMAVDASGDPVDVADQAAANANNSNSREVTRNIKGKKEITIQIAALKGKGYPEPKEARGGK